MLSGALEVLSVGYEVFSSDPRVMVGKEVMRKDEREVWSIKITNVKTDRQMIWGCINAK